MRKKEEDIIPLSKEHKASASAKVKEYIEENFDIDIGNLQSEIFIDFITKNIGIYYYNQAIADSLAFITEKADDLYLLMKDEE